MNLTKNILVLFFIVGTAVLPAENPCDNREKFLVNLAISHAAAQQSLVKFIGARFYDTSMDDQTNVTRKALIDYNILLEMVVAHNTMPLPGSSRSKIFRIISVPLYGFDVFQKINAGGKIELLSFLCILLCFGKFWSTIPPKLIGNPLTNKWFIGELLSAVPFFGRRYYNLQNWRRAIESEFADVLQSIENNKKIISQQAKCLSRL